MTDIRFASEDRQERVKIGGYDNFGLRNIKIQDTGDSDPHNNHQQRIEFQKAAASDTMSQSVGSRRYDEEPVDVDFGLNMLGNQTATMTSRMDSDNGTGDGNDVVVDPDPVEASKPNMPDLSNLFRKDSPARSVSTNSSSSGGYRRRSTASSRSSVSSGRSRGWRSGDYRTDIEAQRERKATILQAFSKLSANPDVMLSKKFTMDSDLEEMENEYVRVKKQVDTRNAVITQREIFLNVLNVIEYLNDTYDPFDLYLTGFTDHTFQSINRYDSIFEELYEKYHNKVKTPPEIRLLLTMGSSAFFFHMTHKTTQSKNEMDKIKNNPELLRKLREMAGEGDDDNATATTAQPERPEPAAVGSTAGGHDQFGREFIPPTANRTGATPAPPVATQQQRQMRGPRGGDVEAVMRRMKEREEAEKLAAAEPDTIDDAGSSESDSDSGTRSVNIRTGGGRGRRKNNNSKKVVRI